MAHEKRADCRRAIALGVMTAAAIMTSQIEGMAFGQDSTVPSGSTVAIAASSLAPIGNALKMLPSDVTSRVKTIQVVQRKRWVRPNALTWTFTGQRTIYIAAWSKPYKQAAKGDRNALLFLASAVAHEIWHIENGADERQAYDEQIRVLRRMGASESLIERVQAIQKEVLHLEQVAAAIDQRQARSLESVIPLAR